MIYQAIEGAFSGVAGLLLLCVGYALFYVGRRLVSCWNDETASSGGMPKWKAAIVAAGVAAVLGAALATQDLGGSAQFYLLDQPEPGQDIIAAETRSPTERFFKTFVLKTILDSN